MGPIPASLGVLLSSIPHEGSPGVLTVFKIHFQVCLYLEPCGRFAPVILGLHDLRGGLYRLHHDTTHCSRLHYTAPGFLATCVLPRVIEHFILSISVKPFRILEVCRAGMAALNCILEVCWAGMAVPYFTPEVCWGMYCASVE